MVSVLSDRYGSQRCYTKKNHLLFILLILLFAIVSGQEEYSQADLESMTEIQLEDICVKRGFQLVNDESDDLTKQDYIEAAQRCLAIEQEMNELLAQYPELADELEEEIKRMEKENSEKLDYVEQLENEISNDSTDGNLNEPGMAFASRSKNQESGIDDDIVEVDDDELVVSDEVPLDEASDDLLSADDEEVKASTSVDDTEELHSSHTNSDDMHPDEDTEGIDTTNTVGTDIEAREASTIKEDLTLTHIAIESLRVLVKNAQDDVKRIINLAIPVLQPLFNVGDVAWHQMKALFVRAREVYEAYQATNTPPSELTGVPETCDDSVYT